MASSIWKRVTFYSGVHQSDGMDHGTLERNAANASIWGFLCFSFLLLFFSFFTF